ncbi:MAG: winged helix DNA-binding protein, partial [Oscillibacter sp.]|nr:winged helix DNA-binding protein [Oscillibacter sp.]
QRFGKFYARQFAPLLARTGLSMREIHVLLFLANHPEQNTARDVVELRGLSKSQVSQAVDLMTGRDILHRTQDPADRRVVHLSITEKGAPLAQEAQAIQAAFGLRLLEGLSETEQAEFWSLLGKVLKNTEQLMEGESPS